MIKNPFAPQESDVNNLKRNAYDLSRMGLFTTEIGQLSPLLSLEVLPGDTVSIKGSQINIQGMPTLYPLQTRLKVSASFYYGRNRTVHDNFEDYIWNTKEVEAPWIRLNNERAKKMISTGSLGDMLGVPSTVGQNGYVSFRTSSSLIDQSFSSPRMGGLRAHGLNPSLFSIIFSFFPDGINVFDSLPSDIALDQYTADNSSYFYRLFGSYDSLIYPTSAIKFQANSTFTSSTSGEKYGFLFCSPDGIVRSSMTFNLTGSGTDFVFGTSANSSTFITNFNSVINKYGSVVLFFLYSSFASDASGYDLEYTTTFPNPLVTRVNYITSFSASFYLSRIMDSTDDEVISSNPFIGNSPDLKISAYKFRLYEQICNYYYRNDKNNPYVLNGEVQYNEFIPTHGDGADDNLYDFHYRNWELDRFTSCTQLPQFGEAPLVGLTYNPSQDTAVLKFQGSIDEGESQEYEVTVGLEDDRIVEIADFSKDIPSANLRKLEEKISYGISINDLRVTNSFQRFLENTLRRGLRYRNQLKSHFGVSVDYPDIDIPQYIGGFSGEFTVGRVESTADTEGAPLGDFTGKLFGQFQQQNTITKFIPEHGFIFCIFSISPIPQYPQSIDKSLLKNSYLDYYLPEFGKSLGHVPVHYSELSPLQTGSDQSVDDVFGYQRAYYDYMMAFDEVHGDFRTNLKDFAMLRTFAERPELSEDFTVIKPEQVNDVFVTRNVATENQSSKHFLGNYYFGIHVARCIPRVGTPSLE